AGDDVAPADGFALLCDPKEFWTLVTVFQGDPPDVDRLELAGARDHFLQGSAPCRRGTASAGELRRSFPPRHADRISVGQTLQDLCPFEVGVARADRPFAAAGQRDSPRDDRPRLDGEHSGSRCDTYS